MVTPTPVALPFSPPITMDDADVSRCLERRMAFVPRTNLSPFRGGSKSRFRSRRSPGPTGAPSGPGERVRTPPRLPIRGIHKDQPPGVAVGGRDDRNGRLRIFLASPQHRAALDRLPPLQDHGNTQKNSKQQSTCGRRRARDAGGMGGVMEVTPFARIQNLVGWRRCAAINCCLPLFWVLKAQKKLKQQSTGRRRRGRGAGDFRGARR